MSFAINIVDTKVSGKGTNSFKLWLVSETMTVEELIVKRVFAEVEKYNSQEQTSLGLVKPTDDELKLNKPEQTRRFKKIDPETHAKAALDLFKEGGFYLFVDDEQFENIDDKVILKNDSTVEFIQLVFLTGG